MTSAVCSDDRTSTSSPRTMKAPSITRMYAVRVVQTIRPNREVSSDSNRGSRIYSSNR